MPGGLRRLFRWVETTLLVQTDILALSAYPDDAAF